jgi:hypothetical protein
LVERILHLVGLRSSGELLVEYGAVRLSQVLRAAASRESLSCPGAWIIKALKGRWVFG